MDRPNRRVPSLFRKKPTERDGSFEAQTQSKQCQPHDPAETSLHSTRDASASAAAGSPSSHAQALHSPREEEASSKPQSSGGGVDVVKELQSQLMAAVDRCNTLETKFDRALRDAENGRKQREELLDSLAKAEAQALQNEREAKRNEKELVEAKRELEEERERREKAEGELQGFRQRAELLEWKLQEAEEHHAGLRSIAAQAEGHVELARAEIVAVEAKAKEEVGEARRRAAEEVDMMRAELASSNERVTWLEEELLAMKERVSLSEFRLREEVTRAEALVAEADELTEKLRRTEDLLWEYETGRKVPCSKDIYKIRVAEDQQQQSSGNSESILGEDAEPEVSSSCEGPRFKIASEEKLKGPAGLHLTFSDNDMVGLSRIGEEKLNGRESGGQELDEDPSLENDDKETGLLGREGELEENAGETMIHAQVTEEEISPNSEEAEPPLQKAEFHPLGTSGG